MKTLGVLALLAMLCAPAQAQTIIKISPDRSTVTATGDKGTATSTIVRDGRGGGTIITRYQPKPSYQPMGAAGYQPMGAKPR